MVKTKKVIWHRTKMKTKKNKKTTAVKMNTNADGRLEQISPCSVVIAHAVVRLCWTCVWARNISSFRSGNESLAQHFHGVPLLEGRRCWLLFSNDAPHGSPAFWTLSSELLDGPDSPAEIWPAAEPRLCICLKEPDGASSSADERRDALEAQSSALGGDRSANKQKKEFPSSPPSSCQTLIDQCSETLFTSQPNVCKKTTHLS